MTKISITIPTYNEESVLKESIIKVHKYMSKNIPLDWTITIADNASTDNTLKIAKDLSKRLERIKVKHVNKKGRAHSLKQIWTKDKSDILIYMDVDLSTDIKHIKELIKAVRSGHDIAFGSRFEPSSEIKRGLKRQILSLGYSWILQNILKSEFRDGQCGFKAINQKVVKEIVPLTKDSNFFFDTELLYIAQKKGFKLKSIPVCWVEDKDSRLKVINTVFTFLKGVARLKRNH